MTLTPRTRVGVYEVAALIGRGGMGEVYRARDTRLHRDVALKVLPGPFTSDAERLARFQREAQVLASLNHPNIGAIYGFEQVPSTGSGQADLHALVLELVEGPTLADRIAQGPIPLDEALAIARQMAEALEAAHDHHIVHRDLKPANVKLRPDGTVKVLDFGLAKAIEGDSPQASAAESPTITAMATRAGVIIGTAAYMSPEQARGRTVDKRADIWAFGCVLYEMLAGKRAFTGDEVVDVLAAVIGREPDWSALPASTPAGVRRLLRRCLVKDPKARLHDIGDARLEIEEALAAPVPDAVFGAPVTQPRRRRYGWTLLLVFVLGGVVTTAGLWLAMRPLVRPTAAPVTRLLVGVAPAEQLGEGEGRPPLTAMTLSPDGRSLVLSAVRGGERQLYLRRLDELEARPIAGTEGGWSPFFSPDGQSVGFWADGEVKKIPLSGGPPVTLCKTTVPLGASWGDDDRIVFAHQAGGLWQVSARGGAPEALTSLDTTQGEVSHRLPHVLPGADAVLLTVTRQRFPKWDETQVVVYSRRTGSRKVLIEGGADARFVPSGHIVYARQGVLMAVPFDPARLEVTGDSAGVEADLMQTAYGGGESGAAQFSVSDAGALVYVPGGVFPAPERSLVWVDRSGRAEPVPISPRSYTVARLSPDGQRLAVATQGRDMDIWVFEIPRRTFTRLTTEGRNGTPVWTPDGARLAYRSSIAGPDNLFWRRADGSGAPARLTTSERNQAAASWSPDGQTLAFYELATDRNDVSTIWLLPVGGNRQPRPIGQASFFQSGADFSPDGRWLAYASNESGRDEVYVQPYPGPGARRQISTDGGTSPVWRRDGRELFYVAAHQRTGVGPLSMMAVPVTTHPVLRTGEATRLFEGRYLRNIPARGYDVTADGQRFLMVVEKERPPTMVMQMVVVLNWFEELKRRVPPK